MPDSDASTVTEDLPTPSSEPSSEPVNITDSCEVVVESGSFLDEASDDEFSTDDASTETASDDGSSTSDDGSSTEESAKDQGSDDQAGIPIAEFQAVKESRVESSEQIGVDLTSQVRLYRRDDRLVLVLPAETTPIDDGASAFTWTDLWHQLKHRLNSGEQFWQAGMLVELLACDRLLDEAQLQAIADTLAEAQLNLRSVATNRRQTAIVAATAGYSVDQYPNQPIVIANQSGIQAEPLYLQTTLRSGIEISHPGSVIVYGDTNPGSSIIANGDILVWGRLRGVAHAGAKGNPQACIMALQIEPPAQLRIADYRARAPKPLDQAYPEVAYVSEGAIRIAHANEFSRPDL